MISPDRFWKSGFFIILAFWVLVAFTGYPAPFIDDLSYTGAGINLALHGSFSNPYCEIFAAIGAKDHAYDYMPLFSYVLAGWLILFGLSTLSFHLLYILLALAITLLIYRLFPVRCSSWLVAIFICCIVYGLIGGGGLRVDAMGLFFLFLGFDAWRTPTAMVFFWKNLFLALSVITFPNVAILAMLLSLTGLLYQKFFAHRTMRELLSFALAAAAAYVGSFLLFLYLIGGHLFQFLQVIGRNKELGAQGVRERFQFFTALGISKWVVIQMCFLVLVLALIVRWKSDPRRREALLFLGLSLLAYGVLFFSSLNSASGAHVWAFACLVTILFIVASENWGWRAWGIYAAIMVVAAFGHAHGAIQGILADSPPSAEKRAALLAEIDRLHPQRLYVDTYALRELYNYRLPPNTFYFETSSITGQGQPSSADLFPHAVAVVSVENAFATPRNPDVASLRKPLKIAGHSLSGVARNPYELVIIDNR